MHKQSYFLLFNVLFKTFYSFFSAWKSVVNLHCHQVDRESPRDQAESMLRRLIRTRGKEDARRRLEPALRRIRRIDIIRQCFYTTVTEEQWEVRRSLLGSVPVAAVVDPSNFLSLF